MNSHVQNAPDSRMRTKHRTRKMTGFVGILAISATLAGCGAASGSAQPAAAPKAKAANHPSGTADVAYAGSLQLVNDQFIAPAFSKTTGLSYRGRGGGSFGVAHLITSGQIRPNVFESIGTAPLRILMPRLTDWAVGYASAPLVIAYSPTSPFAGAFKAVATGRRPLKELFKLMENSRFHLGRTNPNTDPQGQAFILMLELADRYYHLPQGTAARILGGVNNPNQIFAEETILSRLQAGQLDASSAFLPEAVQRHLPYVALPAAINLGDPADRRAYAQARVTIKGGKTVVGSPLEIYITEVAGAPDQSAGLRFIDYTLSKPGRAIYQREGYTMTAPVIFGNRSAIPRSILAAAR